MSPMSTDWIALCSIVRQLRCWVGVTPRSARESSAARWGQLLSMPTDGYLEGPGGPIRLADVEAVEISTQRIKGGIAGRPRELVDITESLLVALRASNLHWELREATWAVQRLRRRAGQGGSNRALSWVASRERAAPPKARSVSPTPPHLAAPRHPSRPSSL